ncbi:hypothetical protein A4A49_66067, partial [Nicotiana attenuata]
VEDNVGKQLIPVQNQTTVGKELVPINEGVKQVQVANKYAVLEVEDDEQVENDQLALVNNCSPIVNPKSTGNLNPAAATFIPSSTGKKTGEGNSTIPKETKNKGNVIRESASQWVNGAFYGNNQSCQEVPSQSLDTQEPGCLANNLKLGEGKVWCDQTEDFLEEEGEFNEGDDGIEVNEGEKDEHGEEEQSVNRKSGHGIQEQTKITDVQPNDKE